jgi:hypothetical protein
MSVNDRDEHGEDLRSQPRRSAGKKTEAVLRLLHGEPLEALSGKLWVEAHRLAAWRDDLLEGGNDMLKGQPPDRCSVYAGRAKPMSVAARARPPGSAAATRWSDSDPLG